MLASYAGRWMLYGVMNYSVIFKKVVFYAVLGCFCHAACRRVSFLSHDLNNPFVRP